MDADYSHIDDLAKAALQYGPFFFAVVFVLFVPGIGHRWFSDLIAKEDKTGPGYDAAVQTCRFYWVSGIVMGLVLVVFSVLWWFWVQFTVVSPAAQRQIVDQHLRRINIIRLTGDDVLNPVPSHTADYDIYVAQPTPDIPATVVAVFRKKAKLHQPITLDWVNKASFSPGYTVVPRQLSLCIGDSPEQVVTMLKTSDGEGQLEKTC